MMGERERKNLVSFFDQKKLLFSSQAADGAKMLQTAPLKWCANLMEWEQSDFLIQLLVFFFFFFLNIILDLFSLKLISRMLENILKIPWKMLIFVTSPDFIEMYTYRWLFFFP